MRGIVQLAVFTLANIIFPAFYAPYVMQWFFPLAAITGLVTEVFVYHMWDLSLSMSRLIGVVLGVNVASTALGMVAAAYLPTGYNPARDHAPNVPWQGPEWGSLAILGWVVAFILSVAIEAALLSLLRRFLAIRRPILAALFANGASYVALLVVLVASLWLQ